MPDITVSMRTWACPNCEYKQFHDPDDAQEMAAIFHEDIFIGRPQRACPACYSGQNAQRVKQLSNLEEFNGDDLSFLGKRTVASDETLESTQVPEMDAKGAEVLIQVGEREVLAIVDGKPAVVTEPIYDAKQRELTTQELTELKQQRDENLERLEVVAVKEVDAQTVIRDGKSG